MEIGQQLLFFFSSLGVFNGFLLSLYFLFIAKPKRLQHKALGFLLLMLSIRIGKSVLHFFITDLSKVILQIGLSACLFIGPFLYIYVRSMQSGERTFSKRDHWLIFGLLVGIITIGLVYPYPSQPLVWNTIIIKVIYALWVSFTLLAGFQLRNSIKQFFVKPSSSTSVQKWLLTVWTTSAIICILFNTALYWGWPSYIYGPIAFSFSFYGLLAFLLFSPKSKEILQGEKQRYTNKKLDLSSVEKLSEKLSKSMNEQQLYKNQNLKLDGLARHLNTTPHILSQLLNDNLGKSFSAYINEYRIKEACALLKTEDHLTLEGIGQEVGFRSKSSFYSAFKKQIGTTPSQYIKQATA